MEKILLSDLLGTCLELQENPDNKEVSSKLADMVNNFQVIEYLPIKMKKLAMAGAINQATSQLTEARDAIESEVNLTIGKIVYGLFAYVINLENDLDVGAFDEGVVDLLSQNGIIDTILSFCALDFSRFEAMVDGAMNFSNIFKICEIPALLSKENMEEWKESVKSLKTELTPEKLADLKSIMNAASPEFAAFKETLIDQVLNKVMEREQKVLEEPKEASKEEEQAVGVEAKEA